MKTWPAFLLAPLLALLLIFPMPALAADAPAIGGTIWRAADSDGIHYVFEFEQGGKLKYTSPTGYFENGTWKQSGIAVYIEFNNKYQECEFVLTDDGMSGTSKNKAGKTGTWTAVMIGRLLGK